MKSEYQAVSSYSSIIFKAQQYLGQLYAYVL